MILIRGADRLTCMMYIIVVSYAVLRRCLYPVTYSLTEIETETDISDNETDIKTTNIPKTKTKQKLNSANRSDMK